MVTICINLRDEDHDRAMLLIDNLLNEAGIEHKLFIEGGSEE